MMYKKIAIVSLIILSSCINVWAQPKSKKITISSIKELAKTATQSGQQITMKSGVYKMEDYLSPEMIKDINPDKIGRSAMIEFSGNDNSFDFTGVTIEVNTKLFKYFKKRIIEFYTTGTNIHIKGLTVTDIGNIPTAKGGHSFTVAGKNNTIENVTLHVNGSSPYGYGDLLGKGGKTLTALQKHSGMCVEGLSDTIVGCSIYSKAFGHLFFVQGGRNVYFKDCYAEAVIRTTDAMLHETLGLASKVNFESVYKNYEGKNVITPGYTKSLSECGFRMYGSGGTNEQITGAVTAENCKAKNTRIGFAFSKVKEAVIIKDCEAVGCEAGYNVDGVSIINSRGDASIGPLLYLDGAKSTVELFLMPNTSTSKLHALACIAGNDHEVTLKKWNNNTREQLDPIRLGVTSPSGTNSYSPTGTAKTKGITLNNETEMPIQIGLTVSTSTIKTNGKLSDNGVGNKIIN